MSYRLRDTAVLDIQMLYEQGLDRFGRQAARNYVDRLFRAFERLDAFPRSAPRRAMLPYNARAQALGSHVILYRIEGGEVVILRVRDAREDWLNEPEIDSGED